MYLYLIRHGEAKEIVEDPERGLTGQGTANARKTGNFLKKSLVESKNKILSIRHSGKKRAEQTARIVAETLHGDIPVEFQRGLAPNDDISIIGEELKTFRLGSLVIVGHLPHLPRLVSNLLADDERRSFVHFPPAGMACLSSTTGNEPGGWILEWMVTPETIGN